LVPGRDEIKSVQRLLAELRPDLTIRTDELRTASDVRWPEGVKTPLTTNSGLLKPIIDTLRVPAELHISAKDDEIVLAGLLPVAALKEEMVAALTEIAGARVVDPAALKASPHVLPATFAKEEALAAFVRSFFSAPSPRSFDIGSDGIPHIKERPLFRWKAPGLPCCGPSRGRRRLMRTSRWFLRSTIFPGYQIQTKLPPDILNPLREALRGFVVTFETGSSRLSPEEQTRLAPLAATLLAAGPALRLVIGAHPDPAGPDGVEKDVGKARAGAVMSFLVEQGVPSADISAVVFDPVPVGSPSAPAAPRSVELLIK
jgi:hypothetical protein